MLTSGPIAFLLMQISTHTAQSAEEADQTKQGNLSFSHIQLFCCCFGLAMMHSDLQTRAHIWERNPPVLDTKDLLTNCWLLQTGNSPTVLLYLTRAIGPLQKITATALQPSLGMMSVNAWAPFEGWFLNINHSGCQKLSITRLNETSPSAGSVAVVKNSIDHAVEIYVLKTIDNGLNRGLLSFGHLEIFWHTQENSFASCF